MATHYSARADIGVGRAGSRPGAYHPRRAAGENLFRIALRYGTTVQALAAANGIVNTG
ncbi:MAG: hypothetical protein DRI80_10615, partial [Chloroflexota bacterium]